MFKRNVDYEPPLKMSGWRKVSLGSWRPTGDSSVRSYLELDAEKMLRFAQEQKISFHSFLFKVVALAVERSPQINSVIRFGKIYPRKNIDLFYHVVKDKNDPEDLSGLVIERPNQKKLQQIELEFQQRKDQIKNDNHDDFKSIKRLFRFVPGFISRPLLDLCGFVLYSLNIWSPLFGSKRDAFGSLMITNVGSVGFDWGYCPLAPYSRIPMVIAVGDIRKRPYVVGDEVQVRNTVVLGFTYDHRLMDGIPMGQLAKDIKLYFDNPNLLREQHARTNPGANPSPMA